MKCYNITIEGQRVARRPGSPQDTHRMPTESPQSLHKRRSPLSPGYVQAVHRASTAFPQDTHRMSTGRGRHGGTRDFACGENCPHKSVSYFQSGINLPYLVTSQNVLVVLELPQGIHRES